MPTMTPEIAHAHVATGPCGTICGQPCHIGTMIYGAAGPNANPATVDAVTCPQCIAVMATA